MKISVIMPGKNVSLGIGDKVTISKAFSEVGQKTTVHVVKKNTVTIAGYVPDNASMVKDGTSGVEEVLKKLFNNGTISVEGTVKELYDYVFYTTSRIGCVVEIEATKKEESENKIDYKIKFKSTLSAFPFKDTLRSDYESKKEVEVEISMIDTKIIANYKKNCVGIIEDLKKVPVELQMILSSQNVSGDVISVSSTQMGAKISVEKKAIENVKKTLREKALNDVINNAKRYVDAHILEEIIDFLNENDVSEKVMCRILASYKKYPDELKKLIPSKPAVPYIEEDSIKKYGTCLSALTAKRHLRLFGARGTGKNKLSATLAWILQRPLLRFATNLHSDEDKVVGSPSLKTIKDEQGNTHVITGYDEKALVKAMKNGCLLVVDEVNMGTPAFTAIFHGPCDDDRRYDTESDVIFADDNFAVIATMNEGYSGCNDLNDAFLDRFTGIEFEKRKSITKILKTLNPEASEENISLCEKVFQSIKTCITDEADGLSESCESFRGFSDALLYIEDEIDLKTAMINGYVNKINDPLDRAKIIEIIDSLIV